MINLFNNFTLYYNFGFIDVFDLFDLFNDLPIHSMLPFKDIELALRIRHKKFNINEVYLDTNNGMKKTLLTNYELFILIESLAQYIRNK